MFSYVLANAPQIAKSVTLAFHIETDCIELMAAT